jgi:hypothetical protein
VRQVIQADVQRDNVRNPRDKMRRVNSRDNAQGSSAVGPDDHHALAWTWRSFLRSAAGAEVWTVSRQAKPVKLAND